MSMGMSDTDSMRDVGREEACRWVVEEVWAGVRYVSGHERRKWR